MIFLGCLFDRKDENKIKELSLTGLSNAANTFQWALLEGLNSVVKEKSSIINVLPVGIYPRQYKKLILETKKWKYNEWKNTEVGCLNLPFIKQTMRYKKIRKILATSKDKKILIYSTYLPFLKAVYKLDSSYDITLIVTDLPEYYDLGKTHFLRKILRQINNKMLEKYMTRVNKFVLLTEQMKEPLKIGNRPYTVVEGIANVSDMPVVEFNESEKVILYTGTLHKQFGIIKLLDAFRLIEDESYKLWICGSGDAEAEIKERAQKDSRIKFYGYICKEDVLELQKHARVLVNPRPNEGEYTKYSFPSKTIEYLVSGIPVVMYKLEGIPEEYNEYIRFIEKDLDYDLAEELVYMCSLPENEWRDVGIKGYLFIKKEKNCIMQAKKICNLIEEKG